jgi:hypothetical protein
VLWPYVVLCMHVCVCLQVKSSGSSGSGSNSSINKASSPDGDQVIGSSHLLLHACGFFLSACMSV